MDLQKISNYIKENWPRGYKISYRYILLPLIIVFILILGASFIRKPELVTPVEDSVISRTPIFKFRPVGNLFYKGFEVELKSDKVKLQEYVYEDNGLVTVTTPELLPRQSNIELVVKIKKGFGPFAIWSRTYIYRFKTGS